MKLTRKYKEQVFETTAISDLLLPNLTGLKIEEYDVNRFSEYKYCI